MPASLTKAGRRCFLRASKNAAASSKCRFFPPLDGQTRKGRRGNETCWANRARISFFPLFRNRLLMHTRRPKTRDPFCSCWFGFISPALYANADVDAGGIRSNRARRRGTRTRELLFIGEPKRLQRSQKERKSWRALLGHQSRPLRGADQTA